MEEQTTFRWADLSPVCLIRRVLMELPSILAVGLIAALLTAAAMQSFYKPQYTTSATVAVNVKNSSYSALYSNLTTTSEIASTFTGLFGSDVFRDLSADRPGSEQLSGRLEASTVPETNILLLTVTADDPVSAFRTLRFWLDNYDAVSQHVFQNVVLRELDAPSVPRAPSNPLHLGGAVKRAFLIGAAGMTLALLVMAVLSDTVQTSDAVRHKVDARLFATIHHEEKNKTLRSRLKRNKKGLLITMPGTGFYFTEEIEKLASKVNHSAQRSGGKVLLVTSVAENEGKSTVAANLALSLAQQGKKVLLIDADLHKASQYKLFGREDAPELSRMLAGAQEMRPEYLEKEQLYAIFSIRACAGAAELLSSPQMHQLLADMRQKMDMLVIDTPPMAMFSDAETLADEADLSVLVIRQDCVSAQRINDAVDALNQCAAHFLGCVFNDVYHLSLPAAGRRYGYGYGYGVYGYGGYGYGRRGYGYGGYGYSGYARPAQGEKETKEVTKEAKGTRHHHKTGEDTHGRTKA